MTTARARVRQEITQEIKDVARRHVAEHGGAALSLRAVARDVGMVSSAVYRYFPSRDDLLTALIIDAFTSIADAAEMAESLVRPADHLGRWLALTKATRAWAVANPQEYALIFGTPVPGYAAPQDTVDPGVRIPLRIVAITSDASVHRQTDQHTSSGSRMTSEVRRDMRAMMTQMGVKLSPELTARIDLAWTELIGSISFELFGQLKGGVTDFDAYFDYQMRQIGADLGL